MLGEQLLVWASQRRWICPDPLLHVLGSVTCGLWGTRPGWLHPRTSSHELDLSSPGDPGVEKEQRCRQTLLLHYNHKMCVGRRATQVGPLPVKFLGCPIPSPSPGTGGQDPLVARPWVPRMWMSYIWISNGEERKRLRAQRSVTPEGSVMPTQPLS